MTARVFLESVDPWINWDWLSTHIPLVLGALGEHVELTAIALATGLVISVPLGVAAHRSLIDKGLVANVRTPLVVATILSIALALVADLLVAGAQRVAVPWARPV